MNGSATWLDVGTVTDTVKRKRVVVEHEDHQILVLSHDGSFYAFQNLCIHRERELVRGVVLNGRLVCPGHQWAFDLATGWESIKEKCQPRYSVRVDGDIVQVDTSSRSVLQPVAPERDA